MKILTFNHHEAFLHAVGKTGYDFDVVERKGDLDLSWNPACPPRPTNFHSICFDSELKKRLRSGYYDVVLCHTIRNLFWMLPYGKSRFVFVAHIHLFANSPAQKIKAFLKKVSYKLFAYFHRCQLVAVTQDKINSWRLPGQVIVNVPVNTISQVKSELVKPAIFVSNEMQRRGDEAGYSVIEQLKEKIPLTVIGRNKGLSYGVIPDNYQDFMRLFGQGRIYIFPVQPPFDEFNLALLEAMNMGLPVVCLRHPLSPIRHNENGLVADSVDEMANHVRYLLSNEEERLRLGEGAKSTVNSKFSTHDFIHKWQKVLSPRPR